MSMSHPKPSNTLLFDIKQFHDQKSDGGTGKKKDYLRKLYSEEPAYGMSAPNIFTQYNSLFKAMDKKLIEFFGAKSKEVKAFNEFKKNGMGSILNINVLDALELCNNGKHNLENLLYGLDNESFTTEYKKQVLTDHILMVDACISGALGNIQVASSKFVYTRSDLLKSLWLDTHKQYALNFLRKALPEMTFNNESHETHALVNYIGSLFLLDPIIDSNAEFMKVALDEKESNDTRNQYLQLIAQPETEKTLHRKMMLNIVNYYLKMHDCIYNNRTAELFITQLNLMGMPSSKEGLGDYLMPFDYTPHFLTTLDDCKNVEPGHIYLTTENGYLFYKMLDAEGKIISDEIPTIAIDNIQEKLNLDEILPKILNIIKQKFPIRTCSPLPNIEMQIEQSLYNRMRQSGLITKDSLKPLVPPKVKDCVKMSIHKNIFELSIILKPNLPNGQSHMPLNHYLKISDEKAQFELFQQYPTVFCDSERFYSILPSLQSSVLLNIFESKLINQEHLTKTLYFALNQKNEVAIQTLLKPDIKLFKHFPSLPESLLKRILPYIKGRDSLKEILEHCSPFFKNNDMLLLALEKVFKFEYYDLLPELTRIASAGDTKKSLDEITDKITNEVLDLIDRDKLSAKEKIAILKELRRYERFLPVLFKKGDEKSIAELDFSSYFSSSPGQALYLVWEASLYDNAASQLFIQKMQDFLHKNITKEHVIQAFKYFLSVHSHKPIMNEHERKNLAKVLEMIFSSFRTQKLSLRDIDPDNHLFINAVKSSNMITLNAFIQHAKISDDWYILNYNSEHVLKKPLYLALTDILIKPEVSLALLAAGAICDLYLAKGDHIVTQIEKDERELFFIKYYNYLDPSALLKRGINSSGTLLNEYIERKNVNLVKTLLERGANPLLIGSNEKFIDLATRLRDSQPKILQLIQQAILEKYKREGIPINTHSDFKELCDINFVLTRALIEPSITDSQLLGILQQDILWNQYQKNGMHIVTIIPFLALNKYKMFLQYAKSLDVNSRLNLSPKIPSQTLLIDCIQRGDVEAVQILLGKGANPTQKGETPEDTPLFWAKNSGNPQMISLIERAIKAQSKEAEASPPLAPLVTTPSLSLFPPMTTPQRTLSIGNTKRKNPGTTPDIERKKERKICVSSKDTLFADSKNEAVFSKIFDAITDEDSNKLEAELLKIKYLSLNMPDEKAGTPLIFACKMERPNVKIIEILLKHGADPLTPDATGKVPIQYIMDNPTQTTEEIVDLLLSVQNRGKAHTK